MSAEFGQMIGQLVKKAGLGSERVGRILWGLPGSLGHDIGAVVGPYTEAELRRASEAKLSNILLPGVAGYRMGRRAATAGRRSNSRRDLLEHFISPLTSTALSAALGRLIGGDKGMLYGLLAGGAGNVLGAWAGMFGNRNREEQIAHDKDKLNVLLDLLVPGYGLYNLQQRLNSTRDADEAAALLKEMRGGGPSSARDLAAIHRMAARGA